MDVVNVQGQVRVVCTDRETHASRELSPPLELTDDPKWREILVADEQLSEREAEAVYRWERVGHWSRDSRRGGRVQHARVTVGMTQAGDGEVGDPGDGRGGLWRFRCPTCRRDVPMRDDTLVRLIEGYLAAGRRAVDISCLPS
jgi:hypothetical protein